MVFIERVDDVVFVGVSLILHVDGLLDEICELLHLRVEQPVDIDNELVSQDLGPLQARLLARPALALRAVVQTTLIAHALRSLHTRRWRIFHNWRFLGLSVRIGAFLR